METRESDRADGAEVVAGWTTNARPPVRTLGAACWAEAVPSRQASAQVHALNMAVSPTVGRGQEQGDFIRFIR